jgi:hypothetical protein
MRFAAFGALALCLSCKFGPTRTERWSARRDAIPAASASAMRDDAALVRVAALRERLDAELPLPGESVGRRCPDEVMPHARGATIPLRPRDVRVDRRQLLPLHLIQSFTSESVGRARAAIDAEGASVPPDALDGLRYLAEFQIAVFGSPKLFRRKDAPRSEWAPGVLTGDLVVYDAVEKRALCRARVSVRVSGDGEPIRKRLRDVVRDRMMNELERRTRTELERALGDLTRSFTLEAPNGAPAAMLAELRGAERVSR